MRLPCVLLTRSFFGFPGSTPSPAPIRDESTWRGHVTALPPLLEDGLRPAQIEAIRGIERSLTEQQYGRFDAVGERRAVNHRGRRRVVHPIRSRGGAP